MNLQDLIYKVNDLCVEDSLRFTFRPCGATIHCNKSGEGEKVFAMVPDWITGEYAEETVQRVSDWIDEYFGYM